MKNINETVFKLLNGEKIRMSLENLMELENYIDQEASEEVYQIFKRLASKDVTMGTIRVFEVFLKDWQPI
ncbi:hypothetical protein [uncultured Metabacillus sp.]|uniref:hypothetical protein n=1 Tax=uncultured Metabacillus sp. TaxID=2860135 RepID=UPI002629A371|nr:hypothetical protein [uncultured Metabacillus sp.]